MSKKVLLVGSYGGIGKEVAKLLLNKSYFVVGTYNKQSDDDLTSKSFQKVKLDLRDKNAIKEFYKDFEKEKFYAVVNCAGIVGFEDKNVESDFKIWDDTIAVNLSSNYYLAKLFYKNIEDNGRFIMISSTDSYYGGAITASYAASKAGVNSLTKSLSLAFKDKKIRVNTIAPGWVSTPMIEGESEEFYKKLAETNPLGKIAEPKDIARLIKFLLSEDSSYLNGQVITLDGGYTNQDPTLLIEEEEKE